ncbi:hypothetical protein BDW02DRAFT_505028 [Decorospora gaudefroyi]|uniref:C2 domain-containing protein n=1 Tax=Decorospora gaudefroyi TaxID=184978 RepID=A0A6A5KAR5_9PLEO|nr:hypothetical protein BDW02DRAFT_505028 [Decorospora gaudefroyi]
MATATTNLGRVLLPTDSLCPPPLLIQKRPRRATFRRRIFRKSTHSFNGDQYVLGPLDDIIDEIKSDIWESPPDYSFDSSVLGWGNPLKAPPSWTVTPLPVSRTPIDNPLTIRKNRNSRSSASGSSLGDQMAYSRNNSQDAPVNGGRVVAPHTTTLTPWPTFDTNMSYEPTHARNSSDSSVATEHLSAQQALENVANGAAGRDEPSKRRGSRLRLFTSGFSSFPRLRRQGTGDTGASDGDSPETPSPTTGTLLATHDETDDSHAASKPSDAAVEAYFRKNARDGAILGRLMARMARRIPPTDREHEGPDLHVSEGPSEMPTTLRVAVKLYPEVKILTEDVQEFSIAVDVQGVLHNRKPLPDSTIDVIFLVDNGYYVTKECLYKSLHAVNGALCQLGHGDRLALYTTHCTHHAVTGNRPDLHYPIRPFCADTQETFRELTSQIAYFGTQVWEPPRPNPSMTDIILGIARSIEGQQSKHLKTGRTHVMLLSPASHVLHDVSRSFPDLYIHRINPATLPYRRYPELQDAVCDDDCCKNVFVSNWSSYQSVPSRIKRILKDARSEKPFGHLTGVSLEICTKAGCELLQCDGSTELPNLRLGQSHTFIVRIRVTRAETQSVNLNSRNPIFNSALDFKNVRQELLNAVTVGATKVHLFDVQVLHQDALNGQDYWNYKETPVFTIRELGGLAYPIDTTLDFYKRTFFHKLTQLTASVAKFEAEYILTVTADGNAQAKKLVARMVREITSHQATQEYEQNYRQKLPLCPGPIDMEASPHEWHDDLWNRKKIKRNGMAGVREEDIADLANGINSTMRL